MDANLRVALIWIAQGMLLTMVVLFVLIPVWFIRQALRGQVLVAKGQGLISLAGAVGVLGMGLGGFAMGLSSYAPPALMPVGLGGIGLSLVMAIYGVKRFRERS